MGRSTLCRALAAHDEAASTAQPDAPTSAGAPRQPQPDTFVGYGAPSSKACVRRSE